MPNVAIQKVPATEDRSLPIFSELDDLMDQIRVRAYNLFCDRGPADGNDVDDWLTAEREICWPTVDMEEDDKEFELKVALTGFEPEEISVTASPRELIIKASHESKREESADADVKRSEYRSKNVYRRVELPADVDVDKIKARFKDGKLEIDAPKAVETKKKGTRKARVSTAA